jgi:uncharacterized membrane protein YfcA
MKPFGGWVHARRGTVNWELVRWLCIGSACLRRSPASAHQLLPTGDQVKRAIQIALGVASARPSVGPVEGVRGPTGHRRPLTPSDRSP